MDAWTRIDNALAALAEGQARHDEEIREIRKLQKEHAEKHASEMTELRQLHQSLVLAQLKTNEQLRATDEKLNILIDTVDRIVRDGRNGREQ